MKLEKAIKRLKKDISKPLACGDIAVVEINDVEIVLKELEKQGKRIHYLENIARADITQEINKYKADIYKNYIPKKRIEDEIKKLELELGLRNLKKDAKLQIRILQKIL